MLFSFELLITNCIADPTFTNRLEQSKVRGILSQLLAKVAEYSTYTLKQLQEKDRHFHFIEQKKEKDFVITKIAKYHRKRKNLVRLLPDSRLCQLSLGPEKERVIGILQQINNSQKHPERNHLFWPLHLDFEHAVHPNLQKKSQKDLELVCIIKEKDCFSH